VIGVVIWCDALGVGSKVPGHGVAMEEDGSVQNDHGPEQEEMHREREGLDRGGLIRMNWDE
jgi:hypothetical protein